MSLKHLFATFELIISLVSVTSSKLKTLLFNLRVYKKFFLLVFNFYLVLYLSALLETNSSAGKYLLVNIKCNKYIRSSYQMHLL